MSIQSQLRGNRLCLEIRGCCHFFGTDWKNVAPMTMKILRLNFQAIIACFVLLSSYKWFSHGFRRVRQTYPERLRQRQYPTAKPESFVVPEARNMLNWMHSNLQLIFVYICPDILHRLIRCLKKTCCLIVGLARERNSEIIISTYSIGSMKYMDNFGSNYYLESFNNEGNSSAINKYACGCYVIQI